MTTLTFWRKRITALFAVLAVMLALAVPCAAQRTIQTPEEPFVQPVFTQTVLPLNWDSLLFLFRILRNTGEQLATGNASTEEITALFAALPLATEGDLPQTAVVFDDFGELLRGLAKAKDGGILLKETDEAGVYLLGGVAQWGNDAAQFFNTLGPIEYNANTGTFRSLEERGALRLSFDYDALQHMVFSSQKSWLGALGYNALYDAAAPLLNVKLQTLRLPFVYNETDYMVQLWKGTYFTYFHGGELGVYQKPPTRALAHYNPAKLILPMEFTLYYGDEPLFATGERPRWWLSAFQYGKPGLNIFPAEQLRLEGSITFDDPAMLKAFAKAMQAAPPAGTEGLKWKTDGLRFVFTW